MSAAKQAQVHPDFSTRSGASSVGIWAVGSLAGTGLFAYILYAGLIYEHGILNAATFAGAGGVVLFGGGLYLFVRKIVAPDRLALTSEGLTYSGWGKALSLHWHEVRSAEALSCSQGSTTLIKLNLNPSSASPAKSRILPGNFIHPSRQINALINQHCGAPTA